mmetsp:Transcript_41786/g.89043  ORF Transcript_41786/g.89043 Transcript_41786/m.89043 type:complete len:234 (+) Transcript_41786:531-1232(+)
MTPEQHNLFGPHHRAFSEEHLRGKDHFAIQIPGRKLHPPRRLAVKCNGGWVQFRVALGPRTQCPEGPELAPRGDVPRKPHGQNCAVQHLIVSVPVDRGVAPKRVLFEPHSCKVRGVDEADFLQLVQKLRPHRLNGDHRRDANVVIFRPGTRGVPPIFVFDVPELVIRANLGHGIGRVRKRLSDLMCLLSHTRRVVECISAAEASSGSYNRVKALHHSTHYQHTSRRWIQRQAR